MKCSVRMIFGFVLATGAVALGQAADSARLSLHSAEQALSRATLDAIAARRELDYALTNQRQAADSARSAVSSLDNMRVLLDDPAAVDRALAEARAATQVVNDRSVALRQVRNRLDLASAEVDQYRQEARSTFETSPEFRQTSQDFENAQNRFDRSVAWSQRLLEQDPDYIRLQAIAAMARTRVDRFRQDSGTNPLVMSEASQAWLAAENELGAYEQWWIDNDPDVLDARETLAQARQDQLRLENRFNTDLASDPALRALVNAREVEQRNVATAAAELEAAQSRRQAAAADAAAIQDRLTQARLQYAQIQAELESSNASLDGAASAVVHADRNLRHALDAQDRAMLARDAAFRDYRRSQDNDDPLRYDRDRVIREQETSNQRQAVANRERDRGDRADDFVRDRQPVSVPPVTPAPEAAARSIEVQRLPPVPEQPVRQPVQPREPDGRGDDAQRRIDEVIRRSADDVAPSRVEPPSDTRDRAPGAFRPAAGSNR